MYQHRKLPFGKGRVGRLQLVVGNIPWLGCGEDLHTDRERMLADPV